MMGGAGPQDQKKSILNKLFKGQPQPAYSGAPGTFNQQLAQTGYGFNP